MRVEVKSPQAFSDYFVSILSQKFSLEEIIKALLKRWDISTLEKLVRYRTINHRKRYAHSRLSQTSRRSIIRALDKGTCQHCGTKTLYFEIDHLRRIEDGGGNELDNTVVACYDCNRKRKKLTEDELKNKIEEIKQRRKEVVWNRVEELYKTRYGRYLLKRFLMYDMSKRI